MSFCLFLTALLSREVDCQLRPSLSSRVLLQRHAPAQLLSSRHNSRSHQRRLFQHFYNVSSSSLHLLCSFSIVSLPLFSDFLLIPPLWVFPQAHSPYAPFIFRFLVAVAQHRIPVAISFSLAQGTLDDGNHFSANFSTRLASRLIALGTHSMFFLGTCFCSTLCTLRCAISRARAYLKSTPLHFLHQTRVRCPSSTLLGRIRFKHRLSCKPFSWPFLSLATYIL